VIVQGGVEVVEDSRTYADVVAAHAPALLRLAVMLTGRREDAEDLLQSTFLRASRHGDRIAAMVAPAAYLRRTMVNEHVSAGRRSSRRVRTVPEGLEPAAVDAGDPVAARDEAWRWLSTLGTNQRAVLVLRFYEDLPDADIAELLECPEATVRSHAHRGLAALRRHLEGEP
jgi:RNA polymerase sigma-70 factor (sigma-E family)